MRFKKRHGYAKTKTYAVWKAMRQRCSNPKHRLFVYYGARGISVCDRWKESFSNFLTDMGEQPIGLWLDRIDNDGDYEPGNCRWTDPVTQSENRRGTKIGRSIAADMRAAYAGGSSMTDIAAAVGVHLVSVKGVLAGRIWKTDKTKVEVLCGS